MWNLHEQILVASLDLGDKVLAEVCLEELKKKFPASIRVGRLEGLIKEQQCEYEAALDIYKELLSKSPGNLMVMKRRACVYKAMGDAKGEIDELNSILKQFPADSATWQEMGDVYLSAGDHASAAHCFEEIVLLSPGCAHHHSRLADVYFSIGNLAINDASHHNHITSVTTTDRCTGPVGAGAEALLPVADHAGPALQPQGPLRTAVCLPGATRRGPEAARGGGAPVATAGHRPARHIRRAAAAGPSGHEWRRQLEECVASTVPVDDRHTDAIAISKCSVLILIAVAT